MWYKAYTAHFQQLLAQTSVYNDHQSCAVLEKVKPVSCSVTSSAAETCCTELLSMIRIVGPDQQTNAAGHVLLVEFMTGHRTLNPSLLLVLKRVSQTGQSCNNFTKKMLTLGWPLANHNFHLPCITTRADIDPQ